MPTSDETAWADDTYEAPEVPEETGESSAGESMSDLHGAEDPREFRLEYPDEYLEPMSRSRAIEKFQDPRVGVERINPEYDPHSAEDPYSTNCADCARCYEASWRGHEQEAAGVAHCEGELSERTEEWAHEDFAPTDAANLRTSLEQAGHGSSAIVHTEFEGPAEGGHAYNVVNFRGEILTVDSQNGEVHQFSDKEIHPDLDDTWRTKHEAMGWDASGRRIL